MIADLLTVPPPPIKGISLQIERSMLGLVLFLFLPPPLYISMLTVVTWGEDAVAWVSTISYSLDPFGLFE